MAKEQNNAYYVLNPALEMRGMLSNTTSSDLGFYGDTISQGIAGVQDVLAGLKTEQTNANLNLDVDGNNKEWTHSLSGLSFNDIGIGSEINEGYYLAYYDNGNDKYYLMRINNLVLETQATGIHTKTASGVNAFIDEASRIKLRAKSFTYDGMPNADKAPTTKGTAANILQYALASLGWNIVITGEFDSFDYEISEGASAQSVIQDIIPLFDADVDAYVNLTEGKPGGQQVFTQGNTFKKIFNFSSHIGRETGDIIRYGKNLGGIHKTSASDMLYTKIYVTGKDGITFASINNGKDYIVDDDANKKYNPLGATGNPTTYYEGQIANTGITDPQKLLSWGYAQLKLLNHARFNYTVDTLSDTVGIGDGVRIQDDISSEPIYLSARVVQKTISLANPTQNSFMVGEFGAIKTIDPNKEFSADWSVKINNIKNMAKEAQSTAEEANVKAETADAKATQSLTQIGEVKASVENNLQSAKDFAKKLDDETRGIIKDFQAQSGINMEDTLKQISEANAKIDKVTADDIARTQVIQDRIAKAESKIADANARIDKSEATISDLRTNTQKSIQDAHNDIADIRSTMNSLGQVNQFFNSEFNPDLANWKSDAGRAYIINKYNGSMTLDGYNNINLVTNYKTPISRMGDKVGIRAMMFAPVGETMDITVTNGNSEKVIATNNVQGKGMEAWTENSFIFDVPVNTPNIVVKFSKSGMGRGGISQPMMVFDVKDKIGPYVPGSYNNNEQIVSIQSGLDGALVSIRDNKNNLASVKLQADTLSTNVTNMKTELNSSIQQTNDRITTEVADRKAGDSSILTQTATNIASAVKGLATESYVNQSAEGVMTFARSKNILENSEWEVTSDGVITGWTNSLIANAKAPAIKLGELGFGVWSRAWKNQSPSTTVAVDKKTPTTLINHRGAGSWVRSMPIDVRTSEPNTLMTSIYVRLNDKRTPDPMPKFASYLTLLDGNFNEIATETPGRSMFYNGDGTQQDKDMVRLSSTITIPAEVRYVSWGLAITGDVDISMLMLSTDTEYAGYTPGKAGVNSMMSIYEDRITSTVSDYTGKISTINQTINGIDTHVKNNASQIESVRTQTANQIAQEIKDRQSGDSSVLSQTQNNITSAVKGLATESYVNQSSDAIMAYAKSRNLLDNSEWQATSDGFVSGWTTDLWKPDNKAQSLQLNNNGWGVLTRTYTNLAAPFSADKAPTTLITHRGKSSWARTIPMRLDTGSTNTFTYSMYATFLNTSTLKPILRAYMVMLDENYKEIATDTPNRYRNITAESGEHQRITGTFTPPKEVKFVSFTLYVTGDIDMSMLTFQAGTEYAGYTIGNAGVNSMMSIYEDRITSTVSDYTGKISTINQTVNGIDSRVKDNATGLSTLSTQTDNRFTQVVNDMNNADSNILTQSKNFTTSQITNATNNLQSTITQTANGIYATVGAVNQVIDSSLQEGLKHWKVDRDYQGNASGGPVQWHVSMLLCQGIPSFGINSTAQDGVYVYATSEPIPAEALNSTFYAQIDVKKGAGMQLPIATNYVVARVNQVKADGSAISTDIHRAINNGNFPSTDWTTFAQTIVLDPNTVRVYFSLQMRGNGHMYYARPYIGNTQLEKGRYISGPITNSSAILALTNENFALGIKNNINNIISGINGSEDGVKITGKSIVLDGNTSVLGDFWSNNINAITVKAENLQSGTITGMVISGGTITGNNIILDGGQLKYNYGGDILAFSDDIKYWGGLTPKTPNILLKQAGEVRLQSDGAIVTHATLTAPDSTGPSKFWYLDRGKPNNTNTAYVKTYLTADGLAMNIYPSQAEGQKTPKKMVRVTPDGIYMGHRADNPNIVMDALNGTIQGEKLYLANDSPGRLNMSRTTYLGTYDAGGSQQYARFGITSYKGALPTSSASANTLLTDGGALLYIGSARRLKTDITHDFSLEKSNKLIDLRPAQWYDISEVERYNGTTEDAPKPKQYIGMIAEELDQAGLEDLVVHSEDGIVQSISYDRLAVALIPGIRNIREKQVDDEMKIRQLEARIKQLEEKLNGK